MQLSRAYLRSRSLNHDFSLGVALLGIISSETWGVAGPGPGAQHKAPHTNKIHQH